MPLKAKQVAYTYSVDEVKALLTEQARSEHPNAKRIEVTFNVGTHYDQFDRGSGTSVFTGVTVTVHE